MFAPALNSSSSASGISVTLMSFTPGPQSTDVRFCMTLLNIYYDLLAHPPLIVDQKTFQMSTGASSSPRGCYQFEYPVTEIEISQAERISLSIDNVRVSPARYPDDDCQSARGRLITQYPGLDFQCSFSVAGYYTSLQLPTGMTREQADQIITDAVEGAIYGPWTLMIR